jgi:peroxiredoxin Q/BCP
VGVSGDTQARNEEFRRSLDLPYPLVGDPEGVVLRAYGVRIPVLGVARRVTYLIGRDGKIASAYASQLVATSHVARARSLAAGTDSRG